MCCGGGVNCCRLPSGEYAISVGCRAVMEPCRTHTAQQQFSGPLLCHAHADSNHTFLCKSGHCIVWLPSRPGIRR
jgi:hypothetical protein